MAFISVLSSSIGKKLLLYGLRQIDILDKDPTDFVSVDVGKRTTLEVRDVGLHIKVGWMGICFGITLLILIVETHSSVKSQATA
jgi:hypothetical protein